MGKFVGRWVALTHDRAIARRAGYGLLYTCPSMPPVSLASLSILLPIFLFKSSLLIKMFYLSRTSSVLNTYYTIVFYVMR